MRSFMVNKALINSQNQRINTIFSEPFYERFLMLFFVLFPLTSSINTLLPFSLNRFLMLFFVVIMFLREINGGCRSLKRWFLYGFLVLAFVYTSLKSLSNFTENAEDFIYFFVCCFAFVALTSKDLLESLFRIGQRNKTIYVSILIASLCLLFLSKLSPESYEKDGSFCGWMVSSHSVAST